MLERAAAAADHLSEMVATAARPETPPARSAPARRRSHALTWAIAATVAFGVVCVQRASTVVNGQRTYTLFDDAMVSMRYAHHLADGHGLVWNVGQPGVEGYTNFLWTLWLAVLHLTWVPARDLGLLVGLSGLALLVANLVVVARLCRRLAPDRPTVERAALFLTATCYPLLFWTLRGMEVGLVALVLSSASVLALRVVDGDCAAALPLGAVAVVGVLTRTDVAVPLAAVMAFVMFTAPRDRRRLIVLAPALPAAALVLHTLLRLRWYGSALPNTYALKLGGIPLGDRLERGAAVAFLLLALEIVVPVALAMVAVTVCHGPDRRVLSLLLLTFGACVAYAVYVGGDAWEWMRIADRYVAPALPLLFVVSGVGAGHLARRVEGGSRRPLWWAGALLAAGALVARVAPFPRELLQLDSRSTHPFAVPLLVAAALTIGAAIVPRPRRALVAAALFLAVGGSAFGRWLDTAGDHVTTDVLMAQLSGDVRATTAPDATIAVAWAGSVPYFTDRPAIDILGKSDPVIARSPVHDIPLYPGHMRWDYAESIGARRPDLVVSMWIMSDQDERDLLSWGYHQPNPDVPVWIRDDTTKVDVALLVSALSTYSG
jgi:arabinofuranosyltransferase